MRNAKDRCANVCQFIVPVVMPFTGSTAMQPMTPPMSAIHNASLRNEMTMAMLPKPSARRTAISRERSATAEYIVLSAARIAPSPITRATIPPSTVMSVRDGARLAFVVLRLADGLHLQVRVLVQRRVEGGEVVG